MQVSTSEAAARLGVSARQMRRAAANGRIVAGKAGAAHSFSQRHIQALERTTHRGRDWSLATQDAALDLLSTGTTAGLSGTERSRLKQRIRSIGVGALAGQILRGRVSLRRAANDEIKQNFRAQLTPDLGLSIRGGLAVFVDENVTRAARSLRLGLDDFGDIAAVEGKEAHRLVLEALALYAYGDVRENSAAATWIASAQKAV